jgi:uncharacterized membrane protein YhhN
LVLWWSKWKLIGWLPTFLLLLYIHCFLKPHTQTHRYILCLLHASFIVDLLFNPHELGDMFHWNISWLSADCMALYSRKYI